MSKLSASASGTFKIGGDFEVHRLGFGAMRITGDGVWGPPKHPTEARRTLELLTDLGVNFIDTADSYGPYISEDLICHTLYPYTHMLIATKGGLTRSGPEQWTPCGRPEYLQQSVQMSMRRLKLDQLPLWQLHRIDPKVPRNEQFDTIKDMQKKGWIKHVGLSEVGVEEIQAAHQFFKVATVQNLYNLANRQSEEVLNFCEKQHIGFIPWFPLAAGELLKEESPLTHLAHKHHAHPGQIALAWLLKRSPVILPIPGTSNPAHLKENVEATHIHLSQEEFMDLEKAGKVVEEELKKAA